MQGWVGNKLFPLAIFFYRGEGREGKRSKERRKGSRKEGALSLPSLLPSWAEQFPPPEAMVLGSAGVRPYRRSRHSGSHHSSPKSHQAPGETLSAPSSTPGGLVPIIPLVCFPWVIPLCSLTAFPEAGGVAMEPGVCVGRDEPCGGPQCPSPLGSG